jgi:serine phosphatase RsbU (regulator of sigma subunit)
MPPTHNPRTDTADLSGVMLEERLKQHVAKDPGFRITTVDGLNWICPYTLAIVPSPFDPVQTAVQFLAERKPWLRGKPKPLNEIHTARWLHWLKDKWESDPRLRNHHPDGRWLNPFTAGFESTVRSDPARSLLDHLNMLARFLTTCQAAQNGKLQEDYILEAEMRKLREQSGVGGPLMPANPTQRAGLAPGTTLSPTTMTAATQLPGMATTVILKADLEAAQNKGGTVDEASLKRARSVMDKILPKLPDLPGYEIGLAYEPIDGIGGDFYDIIDLGNGRWFIFIGDVSGHGTEAALLVMCALKALRMLMPKHQGDIVPLLADLNDNIKPDLPAGQFITAFVAILDTTLSQITCCCAGHHPALLASLYRAETLRQLGKKGAGLGLMSGERAKMTWKPETVKLTEGDFLLQCTDGLFEVHNAAGVEFGQLRSMGSFIANLEHSPRVLVERMVKEVKKFSPTGKLEDDLTVLAIGLKPPE